MSLRKAQDCEDPSWRFLGGHEGEPPGVLSLPHVHSFFREQPQVSQPVPIRALRRHPEQVSVTQGRIPAEGLAAHDPRWEGQLLARAGETGFRIAPAKVNTRNLPPPRKHSCEFGRWALKSLVNRFSPCGFFFRHSVISCGEPRGGHTYTQRYSKWDISWKLRLCLKERLSLAPG